MHAKVGAHAVSEQIRSWKAKSLSETIKMVGRVGSAGAFMFLTVMI
jgi:hypothetical protein